MPHAKTLNRYNSEGRKALVRAYKELEKAHDWFKVAAHESGTDATLSLPKTRKGGSSRKKKPEVL
jgi:hypothetical protein